ncbi:MAG: SUKH-3 domain-containing protein [Ruminococcus sp.]|nr:SUKH-3 domain-containing protein [Ruminococcus sp.]
MTDKVILTGTPQEKITTCLKTAGWYKGRKADLTEARAFYASGGITLPAGAERFLEEYHGLSSGWYLNVPLEQQKGRAPDVEFNIIPDGSWATKSYFEECYAAEYAENLQKISDFAGEQLVWVASIGYYYSESVYMGSTDKLFVLRDDGKIRTYYSVTDMLLWDFEHHPQWEYVTVRSHTKE